MSSARAVRLLCVPDLRAVQHTLADTVAALPEEAVRATVVLVPTRAAALELARTLEGLLVERAGRRALVLPDLLTRTEWYGRLQEGAADAPAWLDELERLVLVRAAARDAILAGHRPPFKVRPRLAGHLLSFYDTLRRNGKTVDEFERCLLDTLVAAAETDRGAARLVEQTRFLAALFRAYERRLDEARRVDEHGLRAWLLASGVPTAIRRVIVTVADVVSEPMGLWPADLELIARLPGLAHVDFVATDAVARAGWRARLRARLPQLEERTLPSSERVAPVILASAQPDEGTLHHRFRDREEELGAVARSLKARAATSDSRVLRESVAVVFRRPLPYLYLARQVFGAAGIPYLALDALPLAIEPYAAALDVVLAAVTSEFSRRTLVELLRSPHFGFAPDGGPVDPFDVAALDGALRAARYLGGRESLVRLLDAWTAGTLRPEESALDEADGRVTRAAAIARRVVTDLAPLEQVRPASAHLADLERFLRKYERLPARHDPYRERHLRARAAVLGAIERLRAAHRALDDVACDIAELAATLRRWIETQTFAVQTGTGGVHLVDVHAARFGQFSEVWLVGLVEGEWPERRPPSVLYPVSLLRDLGWPGDRELRTAARAAFWDLLRLPAARLVVSTFSLEDDRIVAPSVWLDEVGASGLPVERIELVPSLSVTPEDALSDAPEVLAVVEGPASDWLRLRMARTPARDRAFHGFVGPRQPDQYGVTAVERYVECPFKYFAAHVLKLPDESLEETTMDAKTRGRFVHEVFRRFFERWHAAGRGAVTFAALPTALAEFTELVEQMLTELPEADRLVERGRLLGSASAPGLAERVFRLEAERPGTIVDRLLEYPVTGTFDFTEGDVERRVAVRGTVDRVDLLADGTFRVIDYKSGRAPEKARAVQLPVYCVCLAQQLARHGGRRWRPGEMGYVAFRGRRAEAWEKGETLEAAVAQGVSRFLSAVSGIEAGAFPPRPAEVGLCRTCPYPAVCRKDYVADWTPAAPGRPR